MIEELTAGLGFTQEDLIRECPLEVQELIYKMAGRIQSLEEEISDRDLTRKELREHVIDLQNKFFLDRAYADS